MKNKDSNKSSNKQEKQERPILSVEEQRKKIEEEIRKEDPEYVAPKPQPDNVIRMKPRPSVEHMVPIEFDELKNIPVKPIEYIFHPCLPTQGIGFIYAATGLGKTLFTMNLSYAIAQGGEFLKYKCPKPRKILYIDGEMPFNQIHSRLMEISKFHGELDFPENFSILTPDKIFPFRMPKIDDPHGQEYYEELIEKYKYEVIVIDNLSMLSEFDENKSKEWFPIQDWILKLRSKGITVIIVHHTGKSKDTYRGTSKMIDGADVAILLRPIIDDGIDEDNPTAKRFNVVYQKSRIFGGIEANPFEVNLQAGRWSYKSMNLSNKEKIIELVNLGMTQRSIAQEIGVNESYVSKCVKEAREKGLLAK